MKKISLLTMLLLVVVNNVNAGSDANVEQTNIEHGKYLISISGCNDCHTDRFGEKNGQVPIEEWLTGSPLGWRGPWGTTYASNLRQFMHALTEDQWVDVAAKLETRPPMPWFNVKKIKEKDLRAMYQFVESMPPSDMKIPAYYPPDKEPPQPYVQFPMPQE
jgi:mono/diheme cytochrome c family protein